MGFLSQLFGGGRSQRTKQTQSTVEQNVQERGIQRQNQTETGTQTQDRRATGQQQTAVQQLSAPVISALEGMLLGSIRQSDPANQANANMLAGLLSNRATESDTFFQNLVASPLAEARRIGDRELKSLETNLAAAAGGSRIGNSLVVGATAEGRAALESQLAAQAATLGGQARNMASQEILSALGAQGQAAGAGAQGMNAIAQLVYALRGAETTQTVQTAEQEQQTAQTLNSILSEIVSEATRDIRGTETETSTERTRDNNSLLGQILKGVIVGKFGGGGA